MPLPPGKMTIKDNRMYYFTGRLMPKAALATAVLFAATNASAITYLDDCANNGVILNSEVSLGYLDIFGAPSTAITGTFPYGSPPPAGLDHATTVVGPVLVVNPTVSGSTATSPSLLVKTPFVGTPKDRVEVAAELFFEFGTPSGSQPEDTFVFRAEGLGSAVSAGLLSAAPADAQTRVVHHVEFYNDLMPASGPATTCSGNIRLPNMPSLVAYEIKRELQVIANPATSPTVVLTHSAGDAATSFTLTPGTGYAIDYQYEYRVPFGIDPPFDGTLTVTMSPPPAVPTTTLGPAVLLLCLTGTSWLMLSAMDRRRKQRD